MLSRNEVISEKMSRVVAASILSVLNFSESTTKAEIRLPLLVLGGEGGGQHAKSKLISLRCYCLFYHSN